MGKKLSLKEWNAQRGTTSALETASSSSDALMIEKKFTSVQI